MSKRNPSAHYGGCRQVVKTPDCGSGMHGFESHHPPHLKKTLLRVFFIAKFTKNSTMKRVIII